MPTLNDLNSRGVDTARDISDKARHGVRVLSAKAQKKGRKASRQARSGWQKALGDIAVLGALLQSFLNYNERRAREKQRQAAHQAHHLQDMVQDTLQPAWSKTQNVIQDSLETTQDTLQRRMKSAQKRLKKAQKNLRHMQTAAQEKLESGWSTVQDKVEEGSQQVRTNLTRLGSGTKNSSKKKVQKLSKSARRKRSRFLFRLGLLIGCALALLFTPLTGAETRQRIKQFWEQSRQSLARNS